MSKEPTTLESVVAARTLIDAATARMDSGDSEVLDDAAVMLQRAAKTLQAAAWRVRVAR